MKKQLLISLILVLHTPLCFACLNTYQFKIFPVGVAGNRIITVDVQVRRTSQLEGNRWFKLGLQKASEFDEMWILYTYVSVYDKNRKLVSFSPVDTICTLNKYADTLEKVYQQCVLKIQHDFPKIELFTPEYLSYCDFQQKCEKIKMFVDSVSGKDYLVYQGKKYEVSMDKDTSYFSFGESIYHPGRITGLYINSVRVYRTSKMTLVLTHLATGHEISMGMITDDPDKAGKGEYPPTLAKEYKPKSLFNDIKKSTYEEPLLHHGYGFDVFIIK